MKAIFTIILFVCLVTTGRGQSVWVETELFQDKGGWSVDTQFIDQMGSPYLLAHGLGETVKDAVTEVSFPETGVYYVWVRTKDWAPYPKGPGKFKLVIDGNELESILGSSGEVEWKWYRCGLVKIDKLVVEIRLKDLTGFDGRCDAIYFSKSKKNCLPDDIEGLRLFREKALRLPSSQDEGDFDLVVVGGGVAGICASVRAARLGLKVALINNRSVLGGNSSSEIRIPTDGDVFKNKYPEIGSVVREIDNGIAGVGNPDASMYRDDWRTEVVRNEKNISLFECMHVYAVRMEGNRICQVEAMDTRTLKTHSFSGKLFSDCTGDASIGLLAGADWLYGRESKSQMGEPSAPEQSDNMTMGSSNQWYATLTDKATEFPVQEWMLQFSKDYHFELTKSVWNWETGFGNFHTVKDAERIRDHNFRAIYGNWAYLKTYLPERYKNYKLDYLSYITGKRESYRLIGDILLTETDVKKKVDYPDALVTATWGIDLHYPDKRNAKLFPGQEFIAYAVHPDKRKDVYTIPYRCLYSRNIENLFMAGRNISVTHIALGTVRVQRTTGMMGEAVGMAAYLCMKNNCMPRQIYTNHLNELLVLASQRDLEHRPVKVLAIGNSFSEDAAEIFLDDLATGGGVNIVVANVYIGGCSLEKHWKNAENDLPVYSYRKIVDNKRTVSTKRTLLECIQDEDWDYITFQQVSTLSGILPTYFPYLTNLVDYVKKYATNPRVEFAMHQTWAYPQYAKKPAFATYGNDQIKMYDAIVDAVWTAADSVGIKIVIPSGTAIQNARTSTLGDCFNRDDSHLDRGMGRYTAACAWYEVLTGNSSVRNSFIPQGVTQFQADVAQYAAHLAVQSPRQITSLDTCSWLQPNAGLKQNKYLLFQSGFEDSSRIVSAGKYNHRIIGKDHSLDRGDWENDVDRIMNEVSITYTRGDSIKRLAYIAPDPENPANRVLYYQIKEPWMTDTSEKARIQLDFYGIKKGLKEFTQSMKMYLPKDMEELCSYPDAISWFTIAEIWNNVAWKKTVPFGGRVTLGIGKPVKEKGDFYFKVDAQDIDSNLPPAERFKTLWGVMNDRIKVPMGEWFTLEYYFKEGDSKSGRFYMTIETKDGKKQTVFDIVNFTHNSQDPSPDGVTEFNPLKLYTSKEVANYMKVKNKTLQIYWDDLKVWGK